MCLQQDTGAFEKVSVGSHFLLVGNHVGEVVGFVLFEHLIDVGEDLAAEAHSDHSFSLVGCQLVVPVPEVRIGVAEMVERLGQQRDRQLTAGLVGTLVDGGGVGAFDAGSTAQIGGELLGVGEPLDGFDVGHDGGRGETADAPHGGQQLNLVHERVGGHQDLLD